MKVLTNTLFLFLTLSSNYAVSSPIDSYEKGNTKTIAVIIVVVSIGFLIIIAATYLFFRILFSKTEKDEPKFEIMKKQEAIRNSRGKVREIQRLHLKGYSLRLNDLRRKVKGIPHKCKFLYR